METFIDSATRFVLTNDRARFLPIMIALESTARKHHAIIGGRSGMDALLGIDRGIDDDEWILEIYAKSAVSFVKAAMESISATVANDTLALDLRTIMSREIISGERYEISAEYRPVARIMSLGERGGSNLIDYITPVMLRGPFGTADVPLLPHNLHIMRLSHLIYIPGGDGKQAAKWPVYATQIARLYDKFIPRIIAGAGNENIEMHVVPDWSELDKSALIIGEPAVEWYTGIKRPRMRSQYLASFAGIDEWAHTEGTDIGYINPRVPDDMRLRKATIRSRGYDIYNSPTYEPIPYNTAPDGRRFASPFCVLRFLFVEMWTLEGIARRDDNMRSRINHLLHIARSLFDWIRDAPLDILFPTTWAGFYVRENAAMLQRSKKLAQPLFLMDKGDILDLAEHIADVIH